MKTITVVALNVVTVAIALVTYDVMRTAPEAPISADRAVAVDTSALEDRIDALESSRRRTRRSSGSDQGVLARLAALESATRTQPTAAGANSAPTPNDGAMLAAAAMGSPSSPDVAADEPTKAEIERFRQLSDAVRQEDTRRKNARRVDRILDALPVSLSADQREGIHTRWASFQPRIGEIWGEVKSEAQRTIAAGGDIDRATLVADTQVVIQNEFAGLLGGLIAPADSTTIADALTAGGK